MPVIRVDTFFCCDERGEHSLVSYLRPWRRTRKIHFARRAGELCGRRSRGSSSQQQPPPESREYLQKQLFASVFNASRHVAIYLLQLFTGTRSTKDRFTEDPVGRTGRASSVMDRHGAHASSPIITLRRFSPARPHLGTDRSISPETLCFVAFDMSMPRRMPLLERPRAASVSSNDLPVLSVLVKGYRLGSRKACLYCRALEAQMRQQAGSKVVHSRGGIRGAGARKCLMRSPSCRPQMLPCSADPSSIVIGNHSPPSYKACS
jgi:hypothetical protein